MILSISASINRAGGDIFHPQDHCALQIVVIAIELGDLSRAEFSICYFDTGWS